jgi:hypothetical protein
VQISVGHEGADTVRKTTISRGGIVQHQSGNTAIRRS